MSAPTLLRLGGDGTLLAPAPTADADPGDDGRLRALTRLRGLLGTDPDEQIATRLDLPAACGGEDTDHLLPATLARLAGTSADLAPFGWRIGAGTGRDLARVRDLADRTLDAARVAWFGLDHPVSLTVLGPATLAGATFLPGGERVLADRGAVRDLPLMLGEGVREAVGSLRAHVPGARPHLLVREDAVDAVERGLLPTPSGRRRYAAVPAPELGDRWRALLGALQGGPDGLAPEDVTLEVGPSTAALEAGLAAGARDLLLTPSTFPGLSTPQGRTWWETLARAHEDGCRLTLAVDPRPGGRADLLRERLLATWGRLGHGPGSLAGTTLLATRRGDGGGDPALRPAPGTLLDTTTVTALLRSAAVWAEQLGP